jgi:predicted Zn-dependent peptidase
VCSAEIERLADGVTGDEFDRAVIGLKSHLIMQGESTGARAAAIGSDYFRLGRARTLDELAREVDAVAPDTLNDYLGSRRFGDRTVASVGPTELAVPAGKTGQSPISLRQNDDKLPLSDKGNR